MSRFAHVESGVCTGIIIAEQSDTFPPGTWVDVTNSLCNVGWVYANGEFTAPVLPPTYRTLLSGTEWVLTWTQQEWRQLKRAAAGELSPSPVSDNVAERLDQLLDAIKYTNSFDVQSDTAVQFYGYLVSEGFITQARADTLQQGIEE